MRKSLFILSSVILIISTVQPSFSQTRFTISGFVYEKGSRETMLGVNIYAEGTTIGTVTNSYGFYSLTLPKGEYQLVYSFVGYQTRSFKITLDKSMELSVELDPSIELEGVEIRGDLPKSSSRSPQMSIMEIPINQIKSIPAFLGEKDALKVIQLMPGVQKGSEGNSGLYVRGGGPDQNLIILDDAPVYNAYHLFGFFSLFNGDAVKSMELTKGGFPARYGGRLSSVLEINMKDGNKQKITGEAGIGLISSRFVLEGPIKKDTASFIVSARRTYIDVLTIPLILAFGDGETYGGYYFYDLNAKANWVVNPKNRIYLSGYFGKDKFYMKEKVMGDMNEAGLFWDNSTATIRWNRVFTDQLFSNLSLIFSNYRFKIYAKERWFDSDFEMSYRSGIRDNGLKYDFTWLPHPSHTVRYGLSSVWHSFNPSAIVVKDSHFNEQVDEIEVINTFESGVYVEDEIKIFDKAIVNVGTRLSHYYHKNNYHLRLEPRVSGSYFLSDKMSVKASYAIMNQYIHLLSSTGIGLPTDLWVPATDRAPAQDSWQAALGVARDVPSLSTTLSIEAYYKESKNVITYTEGASFLLIGDPSDATEVRWEDNITSGVGWAYGLEFLAHRRTGKLSGWIGYTLSWTKMQFDEVNNGKAFYPRYDRRHDISVVGIYEVEKNITLSATWVYGTGNAVSIPLATYPIEEHHPVTPEWYWSYHAKDYGEKNSFRMIPYHRLDIGIQFHKQLPRYLRTIEISIYNAYNRRNPFFYITEEEPVYNNNDVYTQQRLKQVSIFPLIPSISWSIKF